MLGKDVKVQSSLADLNDTKFDQEQAMPFNLDVPSKIKQDPNFKRNGMVSDEAWSK